MKAARALVLDGEIQPAVRVDGWPNPPAPIKTTIVHTYDFVGSITLQATIMVNPAEEDWFDVWSDTFEKALQTESKARNRLFNSRDRYVLMRAKVERVSGRVDRIMVI